MLEQYKVPFPQTLDLVIFANTTNIKFLHRIDIILMFWNWDFINHYHSYSFILYATSALL